MAAPVGVELAKQPVPVDPLGDAAKARERAFFRDQKGRIDRTRRIIERYHQVVLTNLAGQPGKARGVLMRHHPRQRSSGPLAAMRRALWRRPHQPRCLQAQPRHPMAELVIVPLRHLLVKVLHREPGIALLVKPQHAQDLFRRRPPARWLADQPD